MNTKGKKKLYTKTITLPNGKRKYIRSVTKEDLEKKYQIIKAEIGAGIDVSSDVTVTELSQTWYDVYKKPHLREGGRRGVLNVVNNWILPVIGTMKVRDVQPVHIRQIMATQSGMSKSLQAKTLQTLRGIFRAGVENHIIVKSPVPDSLKPTGKDTPEKVPLTTAQSQQLLRALKGTRAYICVAIMLGAGLRREEVCGLMWSDIDFTSSPATITVNRARTFYKAAGELTSDLKSEAAHRTIPIPDWLTEALRAECEGTTSLYVLHKQDGGPITQISFKNMWAMIEARTTDDPKLLGKPIDPHHPQIKYGMDFHVYPHLLRHTCITRWFEAGIDVKAVQYMAGHATSAITLEIYGHYLEAQRQSITANLIRDSHVLAAVGI